MFYKSLIGVIVAGIFLTPFPRAHAAEEAHAAPSPECAFEERFEELAKIQGDPLFTEQATLLLNIKLRKTLLVHVIDCATKDLKQLQTNLSGLQTADSEVQLAKNRFLKELDDTIRYYEIQKPRMRDLGLSGTKDFARALLIWRGGNHLPLAEKIVNFLIWNKNQDIIKIAGERFTYITQTIKTFEFSSQESFAELLEEASIALGDAQRENRLARDVFVRGIPRDPLAPMRTSLEKLAETYQIFFEISEKVEKMLTSGDNSS